MTSTAAWTVSTAPVEDDRIAVIGVADGFYARVGKRALDIVVSTILIVVLLPVMIGIAVLVRAMLGPGVFYLQPRIGRGGRPFTMIKFRTMRPDRRTALLPFDGADRRVTHKTSVDPRHTSLGRALRRLSLDELPQLVNVLRGDMSLVGPRPELVPVARAAGLVHHVRHEVRPGITGSWQVSDLRRDAKLVDGLRLDAQYVGSVSLRHDLSILFRTVGAVLRGSGS